jgi:hypothetical protein
MTPDPDRLYKLLPVVYRQRDAENGSPLQALLAVIAEQVNAVDQDIAQLYDNWFIETCQDWAVPYIGDLIGYQPPTPASLPDSLSSSGTRALESILIPRREVANTLTYRQRKGTLAILEQMARDLTGWPCRCVEFDRQFAITQALNHPRPDRGRWMELRTRGPSDRLGGAFDTAGRTIELRRADLHSAGQCEVLPAVRVYVWRMQVYALERVPAFCVQQAGEHCFTFSAIGNDMPLFARGAASDTASSEKSDAAFPGPIKRGEFVQIYPRAHHRQRAHRGRLRASQTYYGLGKGVAIWVSNWNGLDDKAPVPAERIVPADLSAWSYEPPQGLIAVDPELGRLAFAPGDTPADGVWVSYCYGFPANMGGGPYPRLLAYAPTTPIYFVGSGAQYASIGGALKAWKADAPASATIELVDSEVYSEHLRINLAANQSLEIRASSGARPCVNIIGTATNRPESLVISGEAGSMCRLEGIVLFGRALEIKGSMARLTLSDCTLVPGWGREDEQPRGSEPSLVLLDTAVRVCITRSILGGIRIIRNEPDIAPSPLLIEGSIVDAASPEADALGGDEERFAAVVATIRHSTILGATRVHAIELAENSLFTGPVRVARRQQGCVRFCYLPFDSRTPSRYQCPPDPQDAERAEPNAEAHRRIKPDFVSTRYGDPGYCQLARSCANEIRRGAEDRSEVGVFHDLFEPQRLDMLVAAVSDFAGVGTQSGVVFVD